MATKISKISPGTKFLSSYCDSMPEWTVTRSMGRGVFEAKVMNHPDYEGVVKVFKDSEINRSLAMANLVDSAKNGCDAFYASLPIGGIVHYHNGFGAFVRCEVVPRMGDQGAIGVHLKPIALVGEWSARDLPYRTPTGTIHLGYYGNAIQSGRCFRPSAQNIYECPQAHIALTWQNPAYMLPIDLSVPNMTEAQSRLAGLQKQVDAIRAAAQGSDPEDVLVKIRTILSA